MTKSENSKPGIEVHVYGKVAYVAITEEMAAIIQKINEERKAAPVAAKEPR